MTALTSDRDTAQRSGIDFSFPVAAATTIFNGSLVVLDAAGNAKPGATAAGLTAVGRAEARVVNAGAAGDETVPVQRGIFRWGNSGSGDAITAAEIGDACYIVDDQTVAKTSAGGTRSPAGLVVAVDAQGVWVDTGWHMVAAAAGALLTASNLSDVASAATARGNLGANKVYVPVKAASLVGAGAAVYRFVAPVTGTITKVHSVLNAALTTGDATLTTKIGATPVTNGALTITQAGSAAGDVDSATPSATNAVTAGVSVVSLTVGGTNDAAVSADALVEITF